MTAFPKDISFFKQLAWVVFNSCKGTMQEHIKESLKTIICTCTFISLVVLAPSLSDALPLNDQRNSLKGLSCISVTAYINDVDDELSGKLTDEQLKTDVELKLRLAKIEICDSIYTGLRVNINPLEIDYSGKGSGTFVANISLQLIELTVNTRGEVVTSVTWQNSGTLTAPSKSFSRAIRDSVEDSVNQFINDYLAANPKE